MADITIMGAGIMGLSIAWSCQTLGARVRVIDPQGPGAGASGGIVGALAPHVPENWNAKKVFQFDSLIMAERFWAEVADASGMSPGYARLGRLQPIANDKALALAYDRAESAKHLWEGRATWNIMPSDEHNWAPISPTGWVIQDTLSARIHPRQACNALAAAFKMRGGDLLDRGQPQGKVIWATGVHDLERISAQHTRPIGTGEKGQGAVVHFSAPEMPQIFSDGVHIIPHENGTVAIGSTSERSYEDPRSTDELLDDVIKRAMEAVPLLHGARITERWAALRPRTRSRAPMLGVHPLNSDHFIANGGFKIGFGMAPKIGAVMADLILNDHDTIPQDFHPEASL